MKPKKKKVLFLSRYQSSVARGVESFITELTTKLKDDFEIEVAIDKEADSLAKILKGNYDIVIPMNGRMQGLKASLGRLIKNYKLIVIGQSGIGKDDIFNVAVVKPDFFVGLTDYAIDLTPEERQLSGRKKLSAKMRKARSWSWGSKVVKIPNGVDLVRFNPRGEKYKHGLKGQVLLSVGALSWYKYHDLTIEAISRLKDVSLLIVGRGDQEAHLLKLIEKKGLMDRVKIMNAPYSELSDIYRSVDLFALPSWAREAFGIVYLEAMATGLGVIAPNDPPRREIVGNAGILVDVFNPQEYALAIKKGLENNWKEKALKQVEKFSWDKVAEQYKKIFDD